MADLRISQMPAAASLEAADILPVVQGGVNKFATLEVLEQSLSISNPTYELVTAPAALSPTGFSVLQSGPSDVLNVLMPAGSPLGNKVIVADTALSQINVSVPDGMGFNQISMLLAGASAELVFINGRWFIKCLHQASAQTV